MYKSILIYFSTFFISLLFANIYNKIKNKNKIGTLLLFIFSIALPVFISTFRYGIGTDYFGYYESYNVIRRLDISFYNIINYFQEPLFVLVNIIAFKVFNSYNGLLFLTSTIFMIFSFKAINQYNNKFSIVLAYYIFFLTMFHLSLNGVRQMIAVSIIFYAYKYIYNRDLKKYFILVLIASLFHVSAILTILLYFIWIDKGMSKKGFASFFVIFCFLTPLFAKFISYMCTVLHIYDNYIDSSATFSLGFLLYIIPVLFLVFINKNSKRNPNSLYYLMLRIYLLQIPFQFIGNFIDYSDRIAMYLLPSQIILFPVLIRQVESKANKKISLLLIILWYLVYYIIMFIIIKSNGVYPYSFRI